MISFDLEFNKVKDIDNAYVLKFKKVEGNILSYRDICSLVLSELKIEMV